jgi:hypothetical protein
MKNPPEKKKFGIRFLLTILLWVVWGYVFMVIPPESFSVYAIFLILLFMALLFIISLITGSTRYGILGASGCIGIILLNQFNYLTPLNIILFIGILIALEWYFRLR